MNSPEKPQAFMLDADLIDSECRNYNLITIYTKQNIY